MFSCKIVTSILVLSFSTLSFAKAHYFVPKDWVKIKKFMGYEGIISPAIGSKSSTVITIKEYKGKMSHKEAKKLLNLNITEMKKDKSFVSLKVKKQKVGSHSQFLIKYQKKGASFIDTITLKKFKNTSLVIYSSSKSADYMQEKSSITKVISSTKSL
jgi:hypothetical protein